MKVVLERRGGFAGIGQTQSISSDDLPQQEPENLSQLVHAASFFDLPATIRSSQPGADRFQYKISVESERGTHTVNVDEAAVPLGLQSLLNWIKNTPRLPRTG